MGCLALATLLEPEPLGTAPCDHEIARGDGVGVDDRVLGQRVRLPLEHRQPVEPLESDCSRADLRGDSGLDKSGQVGYGEGYYEVFARGWSGARRPVDCRIVRRSSPIVNLLFTPCASRKKKYPTFVEDPEGLSEHHPEVLQ